MSAKNWLTKHGYGDVANNIDRLEQMWRRDGLRTRRNWWEVLAGKSDGDPRVVSGITFPAFRKARRRQAA